MHICKKCFKEKDDSSFWKRSGTNKLRSYCKDCMLDSQREYQKLYFRKYSKTDKYKEYQKEYRKLDKWKQFIRDKRKNDIIFRLSSVLRTRLTMAVRQGNKGGSAVSDLGCSIEELKNYLQDRFKEGMSWNNYGKWHIDHIKPISKFDLRDRKQCLEACNYTNLQPMWKIDNIIKSNK